MNALVFSPILALVLSLPAAFGIVLVWRRLSPRGLGASSFVTIPLLSAFASLVCGIVELMIWPSGLKQRVADVLVLACMAAVTEEIAKGIVFISVLRRRRKTLNDIASVVAVGLLVGLGCSLFESFVRSFQAPTSHVMWLMCLGRALLSTPGHAAYSGLLAFVVARRRIERERYGGTAMGLLLAMLVHFTFDSLGLAPQLANDRLVAEIACRSLQVFLVFGILAWILHRSRESVRKSAQSPIGSPVRCAS